jgi:hypothetical protein
MLQVHDDVIERGITPVDLGAAIGGATGLAGGYLYGKHEESKQEAYEQGVAAGKAQTSGSR